MITFSPDITLGALVNGILLIFAIGMAWGSFKFRLDRVDTRLDELKGVLVTLATQKVEIDALKAANAALSQAIAELRQIISNR